jgi:D-glycero-D-manno-heptose 1,7-bisphosphate phosphatase
MNRAVFLDRDGVLNRAIVEEGVPRPPRTLDELQIPPDVAPALSELKAAGFLNIVVTNQPDVARGKTTRSFVESIHRRLMHALPIDDIYVCWHDDSDNCPCRKPRPGLLLEAASKHHVSLGHSYMVGDRWRDIGAGQNAGCETVLLDHGYGEKSRGANAGFRADNVGAAVRWILGHCSR